MQNGSKVREVKYYVGEGVYGYFNNIFFDNMAPKLQYFDVNGKEIDVQNAGEKFVSSVFGPTCDSMDVVVEQV